MGFFKLGFDVMTTPFRVGAQMMKGGAKTAAHIMENAADVVSGEKDPISGAMEGMVDMTKDVFETGMNMGKEPLRTGSRAVDMATGMDSINLDDTHKVPGTDAFKFADEFIKDPLAISPIGVILETDGDISWGRPFPGGPKIGIRIKSRNDMELGGSRRQTVIDLQYIGEEISGPGRLIVSENGDGSLTVRDQWLGVQNDAPFPSLFQKAGHPLIAGKGIENIAERAMKR